MNGLRAFSKIVDYLSECSVCVSRLNDLALFARGRLALFARGRDDVNCGEHSFPICVLPVRSLCK